jgi:hypothetical protein
MRFMKVWLRRVPYRLVCVAAALSLATVSGCARKSSSHGPPDASQPRAAEDISAQVRQFCGACHAYPPADTFPRSAWKEEVERGYSFFAQSDRAIPAPPMDDVVRYYENRAPLTLPFVRPALAKTPLPVRFEPIPIPGPPGTSPSAISNVNLVHLHDKKRLTILACEMRWGLVMALQPYEAKPVWQILAKVPNPAHAEVVDLDRDGIQDVLVADLGNSMPTDRRCGSVVWLRGHKDGRFTPITLLRDVGRVADVQAADFRGTGKLDLVVAAFGWQQTGEIIFLENQTTDWSKPTFVPKVLDERHGTIHVPVTDLNGDGKPDFVALISQENETIVAFLNEGNGNFRKETIYTAPHPAYGSSGIQLVDMDGDGDIDVLYTNGDVLDKPYLLKPYHSVQWLENRGKFPFVHHPVTPMQGVHRAVAGDLTSRGHKDVIAVSFLPSEGFPEREKLKLDAILLLERTDAGEFVCHSLQEGSCDHVTCAIGDLYGTGRQDLVTANFSSVKMNHAVTIWKNLGRKP